MHLFTYEDWIWEICNKEIGEFMGLFDQLTANYEEYVDDKMYNYVGLNRK